MLPCRPLRSNLKIMEVKKEVVKKAITARGQFNCSGDYWATILIWGAKNFIGARQPASDSPGSDPQGAGSLPGAPNLKA